LKGIKTGKERKERWLTIAAGVMREGKHHSIPREQVEVGSVDIISSHEPVIRPSMIVPE
jgi:hypothetical protein